MPSSSPSVFDTLRPDVSTDPNLFQEGDFGIILRPNGDYRLITTGVDEAKLKGDPDLLGETERNQIEMGRKLMALALALSNEPIMDMLLNLAADPEIIDPEALERVRHPN